MLTSNNHRKKSNSYHVTELRIKNQVETVLNLKALRLRARPHQTATPPQKMKESKPRTVDSCDVDFLGEQHGQQAKTGQGGSKATGPRC